MVSNIKDSKAIISSSIIIGLSIGIWRTKELIKTHLFFDFLFAFYLELSKAIFGILLVGIIFLVIRRLIAGNDVKERKISGGLAPFLWLCTSLFLLKELSVYGESGCRLLRRWEVFSNTLEVIVILLCVIVFAVLSWRLLLMLTRSLESGQAFISVLTAILILLLYFFWLDYYNHPISVAGFTFKKLSINTIAFILVSGLLIIFPTLISKLSPCDLENKLAIFSISGKGIISIIVLMVLPGICISVSRSVSEARKIDVHVQNRPKIGVDDHDRELPNILLLMIDALRSDRLGIYGYGGGTTPFLDSLGRQGIVFENHYATSSWTKASVASFFTGLHQSEHGVRFGTDILGESFTTMAEHFTQEGYHTSAFITNPYLVDPNGFSQGFQYYDESLLSSPADYFFFMTDMPGIGWLWPYPKIIRARYAKIRCEKIYDRIIEVLKNSSGPFFSCIYYMEPHAPYSPPAEFRTGGARLTDLFNHGTIASADSLLYDDEIRYCDYLIKKLISELERFGLMENTIVVITTDHGEEFFDHGGFNHHRTLYDEVVNIPLIIYSPKFFTAFKRIKKTTSHVNIFPTLTEISTGQLPDPKISSHSLLPLIKGEPTEERPAIMELFKKELVIRAVVLENKKYIRYLSKDGERYEELFDLIKDPGEKNNLIETVKQNNQLIRYLDEFIQDHSSKAASAKQVEIPPHLLEKLRNLGYIH